MGRLSSNETNHYRKRGWLVQRGVIPPHEILPLREESQRLWEQVRGVAGNTRVQGRNTLRGGHTLDRIDPVLDLSPAYTSLSRDRRLTDPVGDLLNGEPPQIFKGKLICKWPGTAGYTMHQDYAYWRDMIRAGPDDVVCLMLALDPCTVESGAVEFFPGYHDRLLTPPADNPNDVDEREVNLSRGELALLEPGDIVLFHGLVPHRSGPNRSRQDRKSLFFTYFPSRFADDAGRYYRERPSDFI